MKIRLESTQLKELERLISDGEPFIFANWEYLATLTDGKESQMSLKGTLSYIDSEIAKLEHDLEGLKQVRNTLISRSGGTVKTGRGRKAADSSKPKRKRRKLSAEARKRIAEAQKKRWAEQKKKKAPF